MMPGVCKRVSCREATNTCAYDYDVEVKDGPP